MLSYIQKFLKLESASGILLMLATALALFAANTALQEYYDQLLSTKVVVSIGEFAIAKPLLLWINDGLMALFFLLVGLELKREALVGELNDLSKVSLPAIAALGGMLVPALIYAFINRADNIALQGWAIPTATDIAFALGVLTLLGDKVPASLKIFLVSLAIFDDIGAIIIIAIFYTDNLSLTALVSALSGIAVLWFMNRRGVLNKAAYLMVGLVVWVSLLKSGVHATLAGIALAMFIPLQGKTPEGKEVQPLHDLEEDLHSPVAFFVLPVFAFANAGLSLSGLTLADLFSPVPLGILLGLFIGKQLGVMAFVWLGVKLKLGQLAEGVSWSQVYGVALLCGIGFTMSLFIGSLAFENVPNDFVVHDRLGILVGSVISALAAYVWLRFVAKPKKA
ncbi:MAG: Na+/H+ antiporter NhaA [Oceanospirillaceae bacterium]|nr:Na+/H+ antiporter NhaA [Oceanospirillaceae bacterium]MCP5335865.1 Na+/H+ antiporter NhaA [Oceanospirillaceae bacterium]MCP5351135.1 Na+/H+ antiporter NhaA [Oceanospirillaceae bacterium]